MKVGKMKPSPNRQEYIDHKVQSGDFTDEQAVINAGIDIMMSMELQLGELRREIGIGIKDADAGKFSDRTATDIAENLIKERSK